MSPARSWSDPVLWPAQERRQTLLMNFSLTACLLNLHLTMRRVSSPSICPQITCIPPPPYDSSEESSIPELGLQWTDDT